jgi:hypothetical protein
MLGHLTPPLCKLPIDTRKLYRTLYCSLCDSLRQQFGLVSSVLINHELNLVLLAFAPYFLSAPVLNYTRCPAQLLITRKPIYRQVLIDRAAEFCLLLGWLKTLDWATDQPNWYRTLAKNFLDRKLVLLEPRLPIDTRQLVENYSALVVQSETELATLNQMSAQLAAHIGEKLGNQAGLNRIVLQTYLPLFAGIGELILSADHLLDFRHDLRYGQYNPVLKQAQQNNTSMKTEYLQLWHTCQQQIEKLSQNLVSLTTSTAFVTVMQHSLTHLLQQLYQEKIGLFDENNAEKPKKSGKLKEKLTKPKVNLNKNKQNQGCCSECGGECGECGINCCADSCNSCSGNCDCGGCDC